MDKESIHNLIILELISPDPYIDKPLFDIPQELRDKIHYAWKNGTTFKDLIMLLPNDEQRNKYLQLC